MLRRTPLKRGKRKVPTAAEKRHHDRVAQMGCCVCGGPATVHHVTAPVTGGRLSRSEQRVIPLCPPHHQKVFDPKASEPISIEGLSHGGFHDKYGIDPLALAEWLWSESERLERSAA